MDTSTLPVLIVDDQPAVVKALEVLFDLHEIPHLGAAGPEEARRIVARQPVGAVIQDMNFGRNETSGEEGVELFTAIQELQPGVPVLLMTAWASLETAVRLVKQGAADYIEKPWDDERLVGTVRNLVRLRTLELENASLRQELRASRQALASEFDLRGIVYESEAMHRLISLAVNVAKSDAPVLITGPNGSGKERLAEIVQANSRRSTGPFVRVNVGAIPEELMESELFGAEAGAYTGLKGRRIGHFETAHRGTLFLDEVDSLSLSGQVKLLRVLQSGEFQRLGSSRSHSADVRIISATNTDLSAATAAGRLREDLLFRLNVVELKVPALMERPEDILPLARHFLGHFATEERDDTEDLELTSDAREALLGHDWSGNVRELENRIQRAVVVAGGPQITPEDLGFTAPDSTTGSANRDELDPDEAAEREKVVAALAHSQGIVAHAAERLGISRQALYRKMARFGIELERRPKP